LKKLSPLLKRNDIRIGVGNSWTTDAPYRETKTAIEYAKRKKINAVEMEAASLYAFAMAKKKDVVCFAHLTNTMAQKEGDFEKGIEKGSLDWLNIICHSSILLKKG
jgi:purine-nucleoside phosphorylase